MPNESKYLEVRDVSKRFGKYTALDGVSFAAGRGEFISVLGPSGCGKTTILRVVAGLEPQDKGEVLIQGRDVSGLPVSKRHVGIVFQSYALFPNLTARQNIAYGLRSNMRSVPDMENVVSELLGLVGLKGYGDKYPAQLSGGQQQRVALARAMALSPNLLLLDEPLSALDAQVRVMLRSEIRELQRRLGVTTIMVTHDQEEALTMADRILVMNRGRVVQIGTPHEIYDRPATPFVASFIGSMNFLEDVVRERDGLRSGSFLFSTPEGNGLSAGDQATAAIRPEDVIVEDTDLPAPNAMPGKVRDLEYRGGSYRVRVALPGNGKAGPIMEADVPLKQYAGLRLEVGMPVRLRLPGDRIRVYPKTADPAAA